MKITSVITEYCRCISVVGIIIALIVSNTSRATAQYQSIAKIKNLPTLRKGAISDIKIYFTLKDTFSLGYFGQRQGSETTQMFGDEAINVWANKYVSENGTFKSYNGSSYRWIIKKLSASSDSLMETLFVHIDADIFRSDSGKGRFLSIASVDTILSSPFQDSIPSFKDALCKTINYLYGISSTSEKNARKYNQSAFKKSTQKDAYYDDASIASLSYSLFNKSYNILLDTVYSKGIYKSFSEFLKNSPSISAPIWIGPDTVSGNGYVKLYSMGADSGVVEVKNAWGICLSNNEIYKFESGRLLAIEKNGTEFILSRYLDYRTRKNQAMAWRMAIGSVWPNDNNPYEKKRSITVKKFKADNLSPKNAPVANRIDLSSGELSF